MRTAVVIVHGVGDPKDGDALTALVDGLRDSGYRTTTPIEVERRVEPGDKVQGASLVSTYPVHHAVMERSNTRPGMRQPADTVELHEVYWGDLSRVKGSALGFANALFDLVFGLRYISRAAARDAVRSGRQAGGMAPAVARKAGQAACVTEWIARGPMFALNILLATVAILQWMVGKLPTMPWPPHIVAAVLGPLLVSGVAWLLRPIMRRQQWSLLTLNTLIVIGLLALAGAMAWASGSAARPLGFIEFVTMFMSLGAGTMAVAALSTMLLSTYGFWLTWLRRDPPTSTGSDMSPHLKLARAMVALNFCTAFGVGLFIFIVMIAWTAVSLQVNTELAERIQQGLHLFAMVWASFLAAVVVFWLIALLNGWMKKAGSPAPRHRYIIHPSVCAVFLGLSFVYAALFIPLIVYVERNAWCSNTPAAPLASGAGATLQCSFMETVCTARQCDFLSPPGLSLDNFARACGDTTQLKAAKQLRPECTAHTGIWKDLAEFVGPWLEHIERYKPWALAATVALLGLIAAVRPHALVAIDLILDVIAHFRPDDSGKAGYPTWKAITQRFTDVLRSLSGVDRIVIVSHSQGTTVALCALGLLRAAGRRPARGEVPSGPFDLVTMGSPADHLYRHYMPNAYRLRKSGAGRVSRWLNIYRLDDFIGTRLDFSGADRPVNQPVSARGHTDYWRDREVLMYLVPFIEYGALPQQATSCVQHEFPHREGEIGLRVLVRGPATGAPVMLMHELPGMTPSCLALADRLAKRGFRVYLPLLVGDVGQSGPLAMAANLGRLCLSAEFRKLALSVDGQVESPITRWLLSLARLMQAENSDFKGVGVIGMCMTGGFALAMTLDPIVRAAVASQPSMPAPLGARRKASLGMTPGQEAILQDRLSLNDGACLMALRFSGDCISPPERMAKLDSVLQGVPSGRFIRIELPSGQGGIAASAHAVLTEEFVNTPGHPTREAFDKVVAFLRSGIR